MDSGNKGYASAPGKERSGRFIVTYITFKTVFRRWNWRETSAVTVEKGTGARGSGAPAPSRWSRGGGAGGSRCPRGARPSTAVGGGPVAPAAALRTALRIPGVPVIMRLRCALYVNLVKRGALEG
ncbi:hypothetical protein GCM10018782_49950 [Streptomyces griseoaurantiacus]|nr:hypothetical protein GCM10018782_49950 [Streptomyces griseoaurantiacus]